MTEPKQYTDAELIAVIRLAMNNWEKVYGRNVWKQWTYEDDDFERETGSWDKPSTRDRVERMFFGIMMGESGGRSDQKYYNKHNRVPTWDYGFLQINQQYTNTRNEINGPLDEGFSNWYNKAVSWSSFKPDLVTPPFDVEQLLTSPLYSMYAGLSLGQYYADTIKSPDVTAAFDPFQHWSVYNEAVRRPDEGAASTKANWAAFMKDYDSVIKDIGAWDKEIIEQRTIRENEERKRVIEDYERDTRNLYNLQDDPQNFMAPLESSPFGMEDDTRFDPYLGDLPEVNEVEKIRQQAMHTPNSDGSFSFGKPMAPSGQMVQQPMTPFYTGPRPNIPRYPTGQEFGAPMGSFEQDSVTDNWVDDSLRNFLDQHYPNQGGIGNAELDNPLAGGAPPDVEGEMVSNFEPDFVKKARQIVL